MNTTSPTNDEDEANNTVKEARKALKDKLKSKKTPKNKDSKSLFET